jgi:hypothetical protein
VRGVEITELAPDYLDQVSGKSLADLAVEGGFSESVLEAPDHERDVSIYDTFVKGLVSDIDTKGDDGSSNPLSRSDANTSLSETFRYGRPLLMTA